MEINKIGNIRNQFNNAYTKPEANESPKENKVADKLEISSAARHLQSKNVSAKDFAAIKEKIDSNFYNSSEVINKVADEILKTLG